MKTILCVGAFAMDTIFRLYALPTAPGKYLPTEALEVAEGMAAAKAAAIARLGVSSRLWASCGDDDIGDRMIAQLEAEGVDCTSVRRVTNTRSGFSSIFMDSTGERIIVPQYDPALRSAPVTLPDLENIGMISADVRWPEAAAMALTAARDRNLPGLLDLDTGPREILETLLPLASHVIASEGGAALVTGLADPLAALTELARRHLGTVVVTAGEKGCWWMDRATGTPRHVPAFAVDAIDTLAAGDAFHAGTAVALAEGRDIADALRFGSAVAAIKCTRFGGRLGAPHRAEVEEFLKADRLVPSRVPLPPAGRG
jgi:sulfofructose kinase